jgi:hypothetical protein
MATILKDTEEPGICSVNDSKDEILAGSVNNSFGADGVAPKVILLPWVYPS